MDQWAFFDELKAGKVHNVYLFYGPEAYIRKSALAALEKKVLMPGLESMNRTVMSAPSAQAVIESCETLPMMSDYRLIIVQDCALLESGKAKDEAQDSELLAAYLPRVPETTCLVFDMSAAIDKRKKLSRALLALPGAVSFDALDDAQLTRWIGQTLRPMGKRMDRAACEALAFTSGRDLTLLHGELEKLAPEIVAAYRQRLENLLREYLAKEDIEESRIIQEVALFTDKVNYTEETVRLRSHFDQFRQIITAGEPVGRKLDFLIQEMNREINTVASKANSAGAAQFVVDIKSEIEKIREQIQNIE